MFPFLALFAKISLSFAFTFLTMDENHIFENVLKEMEEVYVGGRGKSSSKYANLMFAFRFLHTQSTRKNISISNFSLAARNLISTFSILMAQASRIFEILCRSNAHCLEMKLFET